MIDTVIPTCMVKGVPIYPTDLNGVRTGAGPYHLQIETELYKYWGIPLTYEEAMKQCRS